MIVGAPKQSDKVHWSAWEIDILANLRLAGPEGVHAADYLVKNNVSFDNLSQQFGTGAAWDPFHPNAISFSKKDGLSKPNGAVGPGLLAHEAMHLEQGPQVAITASGELQAW